MGSWGEQFGFEERDAVEAPGGVGDFVDELSLGGGGGGVLIEKLLDVALVGFGVLGGQDGGAGSETVAQGVLRRTLLSWFGARAGGVEGVGAVGGLSLLLAQNGVRREAQFASFGGARRNVCVGGAGCSHIVCMELGDRASAG